MENRDRAERTASSEAAEAGAVRLPLDLRTGPPLEIWQELAEEAERYIALLRKWERAEGDATVRDHLDDELYASLTHLRTHAAVMMETIDQATELEEDLEELEEREHAPTR